MAKNGTTYYKRREFFRKVAAGSALAASGTLAHAGKELPSTTRKSVAVAGEKAAARITFPREFSGPGLRMIAFPLGGLGTGTVSLGGRGQLRDWEIFNRPDKGNAPDYGFASIWASLNGRKPVARVLEARIDTPYEGESGLGSKNVPGLPRLAGATFTGAYPFAQIDFEDAKLPVRVNLEAFNPLVPLDTEASGFPVAILRYKVRNPNAAPARVGIAFSLQNMVGKEGRQSAFREGDSVSGLFMSNPMIADNDPLAGTMFLGALGAPAGRVTYLKGWKRATWWDGPLTFWDDFTADGALSQDAPAVSPVGSVAVTQTIAPKAEAIFTFLIAWHFPNRTPERCGWSAAEGQGKTVVGNHYCRRFRDSWDVATQLALDLPALEARSRKFADVVKSCTLPPTALDAAISNLSILRTNTAFRTADGEFHGFEGCNDKQGCCHGSCTHVWNYEPATAYFFPGMARSLRESEFLRNTREDGLMGFRSYLPDGLQIWEKAAADGQMGCLIKLYRDWQLSGNIGWLKKMWPGAKRALEFAWIAGGWDADRDGVMEGVQHNTYDVEFYGPNPLVGIYYLGALRAGEELARAVGDNASAEEYRRLFENGGKWIDANLFNGEYYVQKVIGRRNEEIAAGLRVGMGGADNMNPDYQMGEACLVDQLLGQYMAHGVGLGYLLDKKHVRDALGSILRYNYQVNLSEHPNVQRTFAVNDDGGVLIASYPSGKRPAIPFPYFAEVMSGFEYQFAAHLIHEGMIDQGLAVVETIRRRHDGERRNPWNEPECGHHYARALASWAVILALNGFHYSGPAKELTLIPRTRGTSLKSFWTLPSGWGSFSHSATAATLRAEIGAVEGYCALASVVLDAKGKSRATVKLGAETLDATVKEEGNRVQVQFAHEIEIAPERALNITLRA